MLKIMLLEDGRDISDIGISSDKSVKRVSRVMHKFEEREREDIMSVESSGRPCTRD